MFGEDKILRQLFCGPLPLLELFILLMTFIRSIYIRYNINRYSYLLQYDPQVREIVIQTLDKTWEDTVLCFIHDTINNARVCNV